MTPHFSLPPFEDMQRALPVAVTLHNIEEAIWLPSWAARGRVMLRRPVSAARFRIGLVIVTLAAYVITWLSLKLGRESVWTYLFVAYVFVMFLNVFVPHVPAAVFLKSYAPGVVTAVILNLPVTTVLLASVLADRIIRGLGLSLLVFGVPLAIAAVAAVFFNARLRRPLR